VAGYYDSSVSENGLVVGRRRRMCIYKPHAVKKSKFILIILIRSMK
jgi:hypothetical protein